MEWLYTFRYTQRARELASWVSHLYRSKVLSFFGKTGSTDSEQLTIHISLMSAVTPNFQKMGGAVSGGLQPPMPRPFQQSIDDLEATIGRLDTNVSLLINRLQPFLPQNGPVVNAELSKGPVGASEALGQLYRLTRRIEDISDGVRRTFDNVEV